MAVNSNRKGKRGELQAVAYLKSLGFEDARRTQQYNGEGDSDVVCEDSLPGVHIEVKVGSAKAWKVTSGILEDACNQARRDCPSEKRWCVLWRPDRGQWRLTCEVGIRSSITSYARHDVLWDYTTNPTFTGVDIRFALMYLQLDASAQAKRTGTII